MTLLEQLVAALAVHGTIATQEQAERLAIRVSGSVEAYLADITKPTVDTPSEIIEGGTDKFMEPVAYDILPPGG